MLAARCAIAGALMGLANLVPGISGGTMLVASGIYTRFIDAIADVCRLRLKPAPIILLAIVGISGIASIALLAGAISAALESFRWGMYSLFIGLTLGGAPLLWKMTAPRSAGVFGGILAGAVAMGALSFAQSAGSGAGAGSDGFVMLTLGGIAGASAMILPGVSGAFLLLILGLYETIISTIKDAASAAKDADPGALMDTVPVLAPVGLGVLIGVVGVSNILKFVLHRYEKATLGFLLGLLIASPLGLYPFREGVPPTPGETIKGELVTEENLAEFDDPKDWAERSFSPSPVQIGGSFGLVVVGIGATLGVSLLGRRAEPVADQPAG